MAEKVGIVLSRMQPLHIGHLGLIDIAMSENDKVLIVIGSSNKEKTIRNPIGINLRREILEEALEDKYGKNYEEKIEIGELPDWSMETDIDSNLEWGRYFYYNVVSNIEQKSFTLYFSDEKEIIDNWFQDTAIKRRINFRLFNRDKMFEAISSTKIRNAFLNDDREYIKKSVPNAVFKRFDIIQKILNDVYTNPEQDKIMEE